MRRFFVEDIREDSKKAVIKGGEFSHLKKVLRLRKGDSVALFDGRGLELRGVIESVGRDSAEIAVTAVVDVLTESPVDVTLLQGLTKGFKPEFIIQKATELGVREVCFYSSGRSVPLLSAEKAGGRERRWRRVAIEAAKQCERAVVPNLCFFKDLKSALVGRTGVLKLALWEGPGREGKGGVGGGGGEVLSGVERKGLKEAVKEILKDEGVLILAGPEGGFPEEELREAAKDGFKFVSLGSRILRSETAALSAISIIQYELGDMG